MPNHKNYQTPESLLQSLNNTFFVCPLCRNGLDVQKDAYCCIHCEKTYPLHGGIPDFRIFPDPFLGFQEDYNRTEYVLKGLERYPLKPLLEYYWQKSDITPEVLRKKFIRSALLGEKNAKCLFNILENSNFKETLEGKKVLEIGSGTGPFLSFAIEHCKDVIGIDIAMRWLHVSRRRFMDKGKATPPLLCCCAEYLPFPDGQFDIITMSSTIEFVKDQDKVLSECHRVLMEDGTLYINTLNRYSIAIDPYSYLWGVGFIPRKWQAWYVYWRRKASYDSIKLLSYFELRRIASKYFNKSEFVLHDIDDESLNEFLLLTRMLVLIYRFLIKLPLFRFFFLLMGPGWNSKFSKTLSR